MPQFGPTFVVFWGTVADDPRFLPFLVDIRYRGASPLLELTQVVDEHMSPVVLRIANYGSAPLRVNTPGDCLNVRADPAASGTVLACAAHGTLLRELAEDVSEWVRVVTPAGAEGWVSEQFLVR